ncbi:MAG: hypothetical protein PHD15_04890 [Clostridia bacterium]|nr:hypothetical protein [Clostridia bacterium]MDD4387076.1 hypothetical protein [Clostridia bacterium]
MDDNIIDIYYQRKKDNVTEYAQILMKNALDKKYMNIKIFQEIVEKYMDDDVGNNIKTTYKVSKFLHDNEITYLKLRKIINYTINFIDNDKVVSDIYENKDYIILISKIILFSLDINTKTNILENPKIRYTTIVDEILENNTKIYDDEFKNQIKNVQLELEEKIKENISDDKKFFNRIRDDKFNLSFSEIQPNFYNVRLNYKMKSLEKYLPSEVKEQIIAKKVDFDFTIIIAEMLTIFIIKLLLIEKKLPIFFIKLPEDFIENEELLEELIKKLNNPEAKIKICLNIDYKSSLKNKEVIENLKKLGFKIAIYDMNKINHNTYLFKNTVDYLFLNEQLKNNSNDTIDFCNNNNLTFFEDSLESSEYVSENYLLKH